MEADLRREAAEPAAKHSPRPAEAIPHSVYDEAARHVRGRLRGREAPRVVLAAGRGLQGAADGLEGAVVEIPYAEIPGFPSSTVVQAPGRLVFGELGGTPVVCMVGRCHYYEGYSMQNITFPVRVLSLLGARTLVVASAVGGLAADLDLGDVVVVKDHISVPALAGLNPLIGPNFAQLGPRLPSMHGAYSFALRRLAFTVFLGSAELQRKGVRMREAVLCYTTGPSSETRAEARALRSLGAEVVGTSTVPEVIVARHSGLDVLCLGLVTSLAACGAEPSAEAAARAALEGTPRPSPTEAAATPAAAAADDDILARKASVRRGGQRPGDLALLIRGIIERL
ncbi:Purine nucleoside phosphorylase [Coemansia javaensis]|uniref:purine-nucleoside phosphorylase n=1 Tax=Coemansia javaensis TaxID=2761396 RepID=A0A9W8HGN2_9FUNG|nr:Purine nucleoside phosphorylase [Coemansia javaensis]